MDRPGALAAIGNTPVVRLTRVVEPGMAEVWVKLEAANPTGSYKDRMALAMIEGAERSGRLRPGQTVVEYTGGSTGSSLALVCSIKGYPLRIVSSDAFAVEKIKTMRAFGADVELLPSPEGITPTLIPRLRARAAEIAAETGAYQTDQFNNTDMVEGYKALGRELFDQLDGRIDAITIYVGTAGCYLGTTRALRERLPDIHRVAVEPAESAVLSGGAAGTHRIEGGGTGFVPPQLSLDEIDEVIPVSTADAFATARRAAREDGVWSGPSTGANITAALAVARRLGEGARVATIQVDSGSSTSPASSTPERRARSARLVRAASSARGAARGDVHRVLGRVLPVRGGLALDRHVLPRRVRPADPRARGVRGVAALRPAAARDHPARAHRRGLLHRRPDVLAPRHRGGRGGAGHGPRQPAGHHRRVLRVAAPRGAAVALDAARAAGRAGRRDPHLGRRRERRLRGGTRNSG